MPQELSERLAFFPFHHGDPGPEMGLIMQDLSERMRRDIVVSLINTHVAMAEARIAGLKQIAKIVGEGAGQVKG